MYSIANAKICVQSFPNFSVSFCVFLSLGAGFASAQSAASKEFMEASSPLKKGGVVVTRNAPGQGVETVLYASSTPGGVRTIPTSTPPTSTPTPAPNPSTTDKSQPPSTTPATVPTVETYPYPNSLPPLVASKQNVFQVPNLGYSPRAMQRPSWFGQPVTTPNSGLCDCSPPGLTSTTIPTAADTAPTIQFPQSQIPTLGGGAPSNFWDPQSIYSAKSPTPLVQFKNMQPGTYLGQGIVGQPKAYVDGQPFRNLFRYFLLF